MFDHEVVAESGVAAGKLLDLLRLGVGDLTEPESLDQIMLTIEDHDVAGGRAANFAAQGTVIAVGELESRVEHVLGFAVTPDDGRVMEIVFMAGQFTALRPDGDDFDGSTAQEHRLVFTIGGADVAQVAGSPVSRMVGFHLFPDVAEPVDLGDGDLTA